jgi:antitoxin (DNA-binding transcriptional repressor) of toxin-antitoxin stability system
MDLTVGIHDRGDRYASGAELRQHPRCREHGETVLITREGVPVGRLVPERGTSADRLKQALRDNPADAGFADDLERAHDDLRSAFGDKVRG